MIVPTLEAQRAAADGVRGYLALLTDMAGERASPHGMLLERGRFMPFNAESFAGKRMRAQRCYDNAGHRVMSEPRRYFYCEGKMVTCGVPIDHAWLLDRKTGYVVDPTIRPHAELGCYYGIAIRWAILKRTIVRTRYWCVLDPYINSRWQTIGRHAVQP